MNYMVTTTCLHWKLSTEKSELSYRSHSSNSGFYILSRVSEVGSPINHLGSGQRRDTGQGPFSPLTGGLDLTPRQSQPNDRPLKI